MPCKYAIEQDGGVVLELWTGSVTAQEIMAHKERLAREEPVRPDATVLSDCTRARFEIRPEEISRLAAMDNNARGDSDIERYAFIVSEEDYENAQSFADQVNRYGKSVIIFSTLDVAATWLGYETPRLRQRLADISG